MAPTDPDPVPPTDPDPPSNSDPVEPTDVDESNYESYLDAARSAWQTHGAGGFDDVIDELENEENDTHYDYDQVVEFVKNWSYYTNVIGTHGFEGRLVSDFDHPFTLTNVHKAIAAGLTGLGQTIAIRDGEFDINHPDLIGKNIDCGMNNGGHGDGPFGSCDDPTDEEV